MQIKGSKALYEVKNLVAESDLYRLYVVNDGSQDLLLRIPTDVSGNGDIEREAFVLEHLSKQSADYEIDFAVDHDTKLHYDWLFPSLVESFVVAEQGDRRVNILALLGANVSQVAPLVKFMEVENVDAKTTVWVLGRLLKLQSFVNEIGIDYTFSENEVLIDPHHHQVIYLGWNTAKFEENADPRLNIKLATRAVLEWGVENGTEGETEYYKWLTQLADTGKRDAFVAFEDLYATARNIWGARKYHPYVPIKK